MLTRLFATILCAGFGFVVATVTAQAADDIEAKAQTCAACHGQNGVPADPKTVPIIWGQQQSYLVKQLRDYRNGERDNPIMSPIAKSLAEEDLRKISAYFAAKSWPAQRSTAASASPPNGIAQCQPCHQPSRVLEGEFGKVRPDFRSAVEDELQAIGGAEPEGHPVLSVVPEARRVPFHML